MNAPAQVEAELRHAEEARAQGNEGRARVCARRAAGIAARAELARRGIPVRTPSAYDVLLLLVQEEGLAEDLRQAARRLTLRVDEEFRLPPGTDLIADARQLCDALLPPPGALP